MADNKDKLANQSDKPKEKKPNFFVRTGTALSRWVREMRSELKKVVWPTRSQVTNNSIVVVIAVLCVGVMVALFDFVMSSGVRALIGLFS